MPLDRSEPSGYLMAMADIKKGKARVSNTRKPYGLKRIFKHKTGRLIEDTIWYHSEQSREYAYRVTNDVIGIYRYPTLGTLTEIERVNE